MIRRLPFAPTLFVAAAVAVLVALGIWQIQRATWKEGLLARYAAAEKLPPISWPTVPLKNDQLPLFRHATAVCLQPIGKRAVAGENASGEPGYVQIVACRTGAEGPAMSVEVGWSKNPNAPVNWPGGPVSGVIVPDRMTGMRLVAASAPKGLEPSKVPEASTASAVTPSGHYGYAATWFSLAVVALIIYAFALRKRWREDSAKA
jgi:surfeit locus 1 family protein